MSDRVDELNREIDALWEQAIATGMCTREEAEKLKEQFDEIALHELSGNLTGEDAKLLIHNLAKNGQGGT